MPGLVRAFPRCVDSSRAWQCQVRRCGSGTERALGLYRVRRTTVPHGQPRFRVDSVCVASVSMRYWVAVLNTRATTTAARAPRSAPNAR